MISLQVALIFGIAGALRRIELTNMKICDVDDKGSILIVKVPDTKTKITRIFTISNEESLSIGNVQFLEMYRKYVSLRPPNVTHQRLFLNYKKGKSNTQAVGVNTFGKLPCTVAQFLGLPNAEEYTGHCFRRSSVSFLADSGADISNIKRHGGWKSTKVAEGYIENSIQNKKNIATNIFCGEPSKRSTSSANNLLESTVTSSAFLVKSQEITHNKTSNEISVLSTSTDSFKNVFLNSTLNDCVINVYNRNNSEN